MIPDLPQFPLAWLDPRRHIPLSVRWGCCSEYLLSRWPVSPPVSKPSAELDYVTMAGRAHALLLRESLLSVCRAWEKIPRLTVVSDGTWNAADIRRLLAWWPGEVDCREPADIWSSLSGPDLAPLEKLAAAHPLGLKLAALAAESLRRRFLFVDSDVLFFKDPLPWLAGHDWERSPAGSVEPHGSFHRELAEEILPEALTPPFVNSGCLLIGRPLSDSSLWPRLVERAAASPQEEFNEQTIMACLVRKEGQVMPEEFFLNKFDDATSLLPRMPRNTIARHYVRFLRHLFHRDALGLRIKGLFPPSS